MNITNNLAATPQEKLPPLIKQSSTYKLFIPKKVEEKIRYLCRKFPTLEWSGVLFTSYTGNFEDGSLAITCEDIYPMDLGSPGFTQFKMDETVAAYIAENIELFDCDVNLVHSHNQMAAYFSGQDQSTLREEGNDRNCFVSLIVNNAGTYVAAITRKMQRKTEVVTKSLGTSYEFFGEGKVRNDGNPMSESTKVVDDNAIEYFMLDIEVEHADNPLQYLDDRFDEIERKKEESKKALIPAKPAIESPTKDDNFYDWIHSNRKIAAETKETLYSSPNTYKEATLFDEDTMLELVDAESWLPDPDIIHYLVCKLLTCSLIVNKDIDLKQWVVKHMKKKYDEIFGDELEFDNWADAYVEFILHQYKDENTPIDVYDDWDNYESKVARAIAEEINSYPQNDYIEGYLTVLSRYIYE